ncbi:Structural maintenance of chromosomes protein 3, partial [Toxocara canis]
EVSITGFRSYLETTVNDFSPRHNVVVGRNGSGKSNFFFAIQFVLSDEFSHLRSDHRQGLIHEGTGEKVSTARVEIVFDNTDRRIVAVDANEVRVGRQVSFKKDQYFIDSKIVSRSDVVNLMESAGFSRSNPYYIVKQGKINELATSPDSHRLKLLREVAGTRVYDERKEESLKILRETSAKSEKIEALLAYIEERLKTLEEEKEDLKEYQKWDKMKRSIEYTIYDNEVKEARKKLDKLAEQREELNTRQSKVLNKDIRFYDRQLADTQDQIAEIERSLHDEEQEEEQLNQQIMALGLRAEECVDQMSTVNHKMADLRRQLDQAAIRQQEAARDEKTARDNVEAIKVEISQAEQDLRKLTAKSVVNGVDSVRRVLQHFREHNRNGQYDAILNGYHGTLLDLFKCDSVYFSAVEVTAGNRLFYHVVDDDRIAMKILKEVNTQKMMGEVNFFPINRLIAKPRKETIDSEGRPLLDSLQYEEMFDVVFRHVFGGTAIVRNMEAGNRIAKNEGFDCVTFDGDQVSRRGAMTGGYLDVKRSRLELQSTVRKLLEQKQDIEEALERAIRKNNEKTAEVERLRMEGDALEREAAALRNEHNIASEKKRYLSQQLQQSLKSREPKIAQCVTLRNRIREMQANKENLQRQLGTPLLSQISPEEHTMLQELQAEVKEKKIRLEEVTKQRAKLESVKHRLENQLSTNLLRKRESLQAKIQDISVDEKRNSLQAEMAELKSVNHRLSEIMTRLADLEEHLIEYEESQEKLTRELEDCQEQQKDLEAQVAEFSKQADLICTKQSAMQAKREESMKKIRELGSLPMESKTYESYSLKQLDKKLSEALEQLKKYENVNKKALDQYVQASSRKEELTKRMDEHKANLKSINDLVTVLDHRKYEAIQLTFKQVSKNFQSVFEKLVPGGYGNLVMRVSHDEDSEPGDRANLPPIETFNGVGIKVSFTGTTETREMQQLSGGQKSLVALALIFAIQKCDPAPFYLFDEIDAALDAQHRKAVADMIHELAENAQFITTTFRAELLGTAEKYFGVRFRNKVSHIDVVTKEQAYDFVEDDQTHG